MAERDLLSPAEKLSAFKEGIKQAKTQHAAANPKIDKTVAAKNAAALANRNDPVVEVGSTSETDELVVSVSSKTGVGDLKSVISNTYLGLNYFANGSPSPANNEQMGLTFFTRPLLNLSYDNIIHERSMALMITGAENSVQRAVRSYLDPVGSLGYKETFGNQNTIKGFGSAMVDPLNPFIPLLSNNLLSLSGWPDPYVDTYTTKAGIYKEEFSMVDGFSKIYQAFDLSANFRNIVGDPISYMFHVWTQYASLVKEGVLNPRPEMLVENEIDYNTRIYRLILDPSRRYVLKIGACGAAFPTSNSLGSHFDYNIEKPFNRDKDQISITFKTMGAAYYDPILIYEFNRVVDIYNPWMDANTDRSAKRQGSYVYVEPKYKALFNYKAYPRINIKTMELEWWVLNTHYNEVMSLNSKTGLIWGTSWSTAANYPLK